MFRGWVLGIEYVTWSGYVKAYNNAVAKGLLKDKKGNIVTKCLM